MLRGERIPIPIVEEDWWDRVGMKGYGKKILTPTGTRTPDHTNRTVCYADYYILAAFQ